MLKVLMVFFLVVGAFSLTYVDTAYGDIGVFVGPTGETYEATTPPEDTTVVTLPGNPAVIIFLTIP